MHRRLKQSFVSGLAALVFVSLWCRAASAQAIDFQAAISKLAEARLAIKSYELSVLALVNDDVQPVKTTDGGTFVPDERHLSFTLDYVFDAATRAFLIARNDRDQTLATKEAKTNGWHVYAETPNAVYSGLNGRLSVAGKFKPEKPKYFDPLGLGLAFEGEFHRGDSWQTIVKNYKSWNGMRLEANNSELLSYRSGDVQIDIDPERAYWPTKLTFLAQERPFITETQLVLIRGQWLPDTSHVQTLSRDTRLKFVWKTLNSPVSNRFQVSDIASRYELKMNDR